MSPRVNYCAFYGINTAGLPGQQNLSRPVRQILEETFELVDLSPSIAKIASFPSLLNVISAMHRVLLRRIFCKGSNEVTVIDMVHSFVALDLKHSNDRILVLGHDSYSLRTLRDMRAARGLFSRFRLVLSYVGWSYIEFLMRRIAWRTFFVSPIDGKHAASRTSSALIAIPVARPIRDAGVIIRDRKNRLPNKRPRLLVPVAVLNLAQNNIDIELLERLIRTVKGQADITLWGAAATTVAQGLPSLDELSVVDWVDDYIGFITGFDLMVYPRIIGSGFHTKLAEALVLGVHCLCVDWIAEPLINAGYLGLTSFANSEEFESNLAACLTALKTDEGLPKPIIPNNSAPQIALAPLVESCTEALNEKSSHK